MTETTARFGWPLLAPGQAQKEMTHNEALASIDLAVAPVVEGIAAGPPAAPAIGDTWIVGAAPEGEWVGRTDALAGWTAGGWRFVAPPPGLCATRRGDLASLRFGGSGWQTPATVAGPEGGAVIDTEARATLGILIDALRARGLIADLP